MTDLPSQPGPAEHDQEAARARNLALARGLGLSPYGTREDNLLPIAHARAAYDPDADAEQQAGAKGAQPVDRRPRVRIAGRVVLHRDTGKLVWMNLRDESGDMQVAVSQRDCAAPGFDLAKIADLGDIVVAAGPVMKTRTGEVTIWASALAPGAKCLIPPPSKHEGLQDLEARYRGRYIDLWVNPDAAEVFRARSRIVTNLRAMLDARGYLEVETPMLQALAGGAAARPFRTHLNALDLDLYLRIAPELYLKRLLVAGLPRVYEINRNFRNEGVDRRHNPEFTMLEAYHAFGDARTMMDLTESLVRESARVRIAQRDSADPARVDNLTLPFAEWTIDYARPFDRVPYPDLFERALGFPITDPDRVRAEAARRSMRTASDAGVPIDPTLLTNELFEAFAEPTLDPTRPTFITDYPSAISPLTRPKPDNPFLADRADLFIGRMELAPHYTELNDPAVQADIFRRQLSGLNEEESTFRTFDEDFIRALRVGMPPAGGMGLGIDRLVMLLTNQRSIRDVLLFPFMRPE